MTNRIKKAFPDHFIQALAEATDSGKLAITLIISPDIVANLVRGEASLLRLEDGGVVILLPQLTIEQAFSRETGEAEPAEETAKK